MATTNTQLEPLNLTIPLCTNPQCPSQVPHLVASFGFHPPDIFAAFTRLMQNQHREKDLDNISIFELVHGGTFSFIPDVEGSIERTYMCGHDCHKTRHDELLVLVRAQVATDEQARQALLEFQCSHKVRPSDKIERGRFVRNRVELGSVFCFWAVRLGACDDRDLI